MRARGARSHGAVSGARRILAANCRDALRAERLASGVMMTNRLRWLVVDERGDGAKRVLDQVAEDRGAAAVMRGADLVDFDEALSEGAWDVLVVVSPLRTQTVSHLIARARSRSEHLIAIVVSSVDDPALESQGMLDALAAGARFFLPLRQLSALALLVERDVEESRQRRALSRQNELVLSAAGEGIYGLDLEGRTTFVNPAAAAMVGWSADEIMGRPQHALLHHSRPDGSPYPRTECPIYAAFTDGAVHHIEDEVFWRKDGTSFPVEYISTPMRDGDRLVGAVVTFRDVTQQRAAAAELEASRRELVSTVEHLAATEDMVLAGYAAASAARRAHEAIAAVASSLPDGPGRDALARTQGLLAELEQLGHAPSAAPPPIVDLMAAARAALGAGGVPTGRPPLTATVVPADLDAALRQIASLLERPFEVEIADDGAVPSISIRGRAQPRAGRRSRARDDPPDRRAQSRGPRDPSRRGRLHHVRREPGQPACLRSPSFASRTKRSARSSRE